MADQQTAIRLIVGLGNPGPKYLATRHNAGFWFLDALASRFNVTLRQETKFKGEVGKAVINGEDVWLLKPDTFMNLSGQSVAALARFYKIDPQQVLVVHDELDLPPGTVRLKRGGGHGGHNGLRDTASRLGSKDFMRLRLGIGHPGQKELVHDYVLGKPSRDDHISIENAIDDALRVISDIVQGDMDKAMNDLHRG
jgi:PTH1 family peptidyl-tRNA hydrolase